MVLLAFVSCCRFGDCGVEMFGFAFADESTRDMAWRPRPNNQAQLMLSWQRMISQVREESTSLNPNTDHLLTYLQKFTTEMRIVQRCTGKGSCRRISES